MATAKLYGKALLSLFDKTIDYLDDDIYAALLTSAYGLNQDTQQFWSDVVPGELVGTGYTTNGLALSGKSMYYNSSTNTLTLDADDLVWTNTTWTAVRYLVIYDRTPATDAARPLLSYVDFGSDQVTTGVDFTYRVSSDGLIQGTVS